jgi:transposase
VIDYQTWHRLRHLHLSAGLNAVQIARETGLHPETVRQWLKRERYERRAVPPRATKLDAFKPEIGRLLGQFAYSARQIFQTLAAKGYTGGYTQVKRYVRLVRPRPAPAYLELVFGPGECLQWDWADCGTLPVGQCRRRLYAFVMVLCWSRQMYVEFALRKTQEHFLSCHRHGLEAFGGVTRAVMCDNDRVAILRHERYCPAVPTPLYGDFIRHYGFEELRACTPRQAHEKGVVENTVRYLRGNFLAGRTFRSVEEANAAAREWLDTVANLRLHARTRRRPADMFAEERASLGPLPPCPYDCGINENVKASSQFRVHFDGNRYSVPAACASQALVLRRYPDRVLIFRQEQMVAEHVRSYDRGEPVTSPDHAGPLLEHRRRARGQVLLQAFLQLTPAAAQYCRELELRDLYALSHIRRIMALASVHGTENTAQAIEDALHFQAFGADYIASLLDQRRRLLPPPAPLHLARNQDLLDLSIAPPDLDVYDRNHPEPTSEPDPNQAT